LNGREKSERRGKRARSNIRERRDQGGVRACAKESRCQSIILGRNGWEERGDTKGNREIPIIGEGYNHMVGTGIAEQKTGARTRRQCNEKTGSMVQKNVWSGAKFWEQWNVKRGGKPKKSSGDGHRMTKVRAGAKVFEKSKKKGLVGGGNHSLRGESSTKQDQGFVHKCIKRIICHYTLVQRLREVTIQRGDSGNSLSLRQLYKREG